MKIYLKTEHLGTHPWIFRKMIHPPKKKLAPGTVVEVVSRSGKSLGRGFYHPSRTVAVRLLTSQPGELLDPQFFYNRLMQAKILREEILEIPKCSDSYRLIHGEADGLSGLVIDKYNRVIVIEPFSAGYLTFMDDIVSLLQELYPEARVGVRPDDKTEQQEGASFQQIAQKYPCPPSVKIQENRLKMEVNLSTGHKTGYFLDQRENRAKIAELSRGKEVWDLYCYTGGFALSAALGGAKSVLGVDLDEKALEIARKNALLNRVSVEFLHLDCFDFLRTMEKEGKQADLIILDPAKLAGVRAELSRALKTYNDINRLALGRVKKGGLLLSCSCSGLVSESQFLNILTNASREAKVSFQIFYIGGASPDHPIRTDFLEGRYLKAILGRVL
ncbi:MAG: class I SAM-dependent rRNA methyltransferase [Spirochaetales bacterium]